MTSCRFVVTTVFAIVLLGLAPLIIVGQEAGTLYSLTRYRNQNRPVCLNFQSGLNASESDPCDLRFGLLGINNDFDWLQSSTARGNRSVIKDLGSHSWTDVFSVPVVAALPKLKDGEQRRITIDISGADGKDGAPGRDGAPSASADGRRGFDSGFSAVRAEPGALTLADDQGRLIWHPTPAPALTTKRGPKNDGTPKIDPLFAKAIVGHMYAIHVVDDVRDYYALFRVDALQDGACTLSWKIIPAP